MASTAFLAALRTDHTLVTTATFKDAFTNVVTPLSVLSGSTVTVNVTAGNRRMLNLVCAPEQSVADILSSPGGEITVKQTMVFIDRTTEDVPLGVFPVDTEGLSYRSDGQLQITAPDRWVQVQRNKFGLSRSSVAGNTGSQEIKRLVEGAWPNGAYPFPGWAAGSPSSAATTKVGSLIWDDGDREAAILQLAAANSLDVYFDANGLAVLEPLPVLTDATLSVWLVNAGDGGVFLDGDREVDLSTLRNAVIASSSASDIILTPVEVKNTHTPGLDPLSTLGPLGYRPEYVSSPALRTTAQAQAFAKTTLQRFLSVAQQVSLTAVSNPALDGWDVIDIVYPVGDTGQRPTDHQMIESVVIPLTQDGTQTITMRSTRPTSDDTT